MKLLLILLVLVPAAALATPLEDGKARCRRCAAVETARTGPAWVELEERHAHAPAYVVSMRTRSGWHHGEILALADASRRDVTATQLRAGTFSNGSRAAVIELDLRRARTARERHVVVCSVDATPTCATPVVEPCDKRCKPAVFRRGVLEPAR